MQRLSQQLKTWGTELGFAELRITDTDLSAAEPWLMAWLAQGMHGEMDYMAKHGSPPGSLRARPAELVPGTLRIITARMDYLPPGTVTADHLAKEHRRLTQPGEAVISLYARGRDYHKVLRNRLQQLATRLEHAAAGSGLSTQHRVFTDSAPVMEVELAQKAGLGWRGKHTLLIHRQAGSLFFLGEIFTTLPLPVDAPTRPHCGSCQSCIQACPTGAIIAPYQLDARRCISYLTIEHQSAIPEALRPLIGNRIYGCDDCQLVCPWNKFAQASQLPDFAVRNGLDTAGLLTLFAWEEATFNQRMEGSAIRRIGHLRWLRNLAVALGNALRQQALPAEQAAIRHALQLRLSHPSELVREHVVWALRQSHQPS